MLDLEINHTKVLTSIIIKNDNIKNENKGRSISWRPEKPTRKKNWRVNRGGWSSPITKQTEVTTLFYTSWRARRCPWRKKNWNKNIKWKQKYPKTSVFSPFGLAVWPAIGDIYTNVLFYCIDLVWEPSLAWTQIFTCMCQPTYLT